MAKGLLLAAFDYRTAHADEFNAWYDTEHVPERLAVPGFINAERWVGDEDPFIHIATYDLDNVDVLRTPAYRAVSAGNNTPWTNRVTGMCKRIMRFEGEQLRPGDLTAPREAGALLLASMTPARDAEADFHAWYDQEHLPQLAAVPGVLAARRYRATDHASERGYVALYHLRDAGVSRSDAWAKAAYTPWTERMRPLLHDLLVIRLNRTQPKV